MKIFYDEDNNIFTGEFLVSNDTNPEVKEYKPTGQEGYHESKTKTRISVDPCVWLNGSCRYCDQPKPDSKSINVYLKDVQDWGEEVYCYLIGEENTKPFGNFPGKKMNTGESGIFSIEIPKGYEYGEVVFSNGTSETATRSKRLPGIYAYYTGVDAKRFVTLRYLPGSKNLKTVSLGFNAEIKEEDLGFVKYVSGFDRSSDSIIFKPLPGNKVKAKEGLHIEVDSSPKEIIFVETYDEDVSSIIGNLLIGSGDESISHKLLMNVFGGFDLFGLRLNTDTNNLEYMKLGEDDICPIGGAVLRLSKIDK